MNIIAIIQARLSSSRLPGKVLMDIEGKSMLWHVIGRVKKATLIDQVAIAVPSTDQELASVAIGNCGFFAYVGDEDDVLDRYYQAAKFYEAGIIVRITGDCPLIDPEVIDRTIQYFLDNNIDYIYNLPPYPDGLDVEVFSFGALVKTWKEAKDPYDKEHVTTYIRYHPELFRIGKLDGLDLSHYKWSVDTAEDLEFARWVYQKLGDNFRLSDILKLIGGNK